MSMRIQNIHNQSILKPQIQNLSLKKIISEINSNVGKKQNFDTLELSKKAHALLKDNNEVKDKEPTLNYNNSESKAKTVFSCETC